MANDPKTKKNMRDPRPGEIKVTADAGDGGITSVSYPSAPLEDAWTEAQADAFIDELVERNKEALRGLAKL